MKKTLPIFLFTAIIFPLYLSGCGVKNEVISTDIPFVPEGTVVLSEEDITQGGAIGEQSNLAPSDTPRGIAEGGMYLPYTPTALAQASGNIVLFFYASWSPESIATNKDITEKKDTIAKDLTILQVNFDDADAMREQYGVTDQQTFVQVTNTGELVKKWRGANTLAEIAQQVQK